MNSSENGLSSISRIKAKVIDPKFSIGLADGQGIEVKNNSGYEANLYNWELHSGNIFFKFPMDTIILPGSSVVFSPENTKIRLAYGQPVFLENPAGMEIAGADFKPLSQAPSAAFLRSLFRRMK